jgi:hypothetical protein
MPRATSSTNVIATIGIDIGKNTFHVIGLDDKGGLRALRTEMPIVLAKTDKLSQRMIHMIEDLCTDWRHLDRRIVTVSKEIETLSEQDHQHALSCFVEHDPYHLIAAS